VHNMADAAVQGVSCPGPAVDLLSGTVYSSGSLTLSPYHYLWLKPR
jgi:hypothetical protein